MVPRAVRMRACASGWGRAVGLARRGEELRGSGDGAPLHAVREGAARGPRWRGDAGRAADRGLCCSWTYLAEQHKPCLVRS